MPKSKRKRARRAPPQQQNTQLIVRRPDGQEWLLGNVRYLNVRALSERGVLEVGPHLLQPVMRGALSVEGVVDAPSGLRVTFTECAEGQLRVRGTR